MTLDPLCALVDRLCESRSFAHPAPRIERVETHISWVILAGDYAYKLKKALNLGFLDFSTLEKRRTACEEEVRLNRRLAPGLYIDVVAITGTPDDPSIGGNGTAIEHAVRMRRFDRACELDRLLAADALPVERIDELARLVARFHATLPPATAEGPCGTPPVALANADANFEHVLMLEHAPDIVGRITALRQWTQAEHARVAPQMARRLREGRVRECHGDLHLANMVLHEDKVVVFDCIEFNPALRWIDVMAEIAFTVMDLRHRGHQEFAQRFLNDYLEESGDYAGLAVLRFYLVYRAMVRAKIAAIRAPQETDAAASARSHAEFHTYLALAEAFAHPQPPSMVITCGPSGSGKSYLAAKLAGTGEWIRIRSDVERRRLAGLEPGQRSGLTLGAGMYAAPMGERTYARLLDLAQVVVEAGFPVIVDATFLARAQRDAFRTLAAARRVPFAILKPQVPVAVMRERVVARADAGSDASEATAAVLEQQLAQAQALAADEEALAVEFDNRGSADVARLAAAVRMRLSG